MKESKMEYNRTQTRTFLLRTFINTEQDIIRHLEAQKNVNGYIKSLIRADMQKEHYEKDVHPQIGVSNVGRTQQMICDIIESSDHTRQWFASVLGISRQALFLKMQKKNFTVHDIEVIFDELGYDIDMCLTKKMPEKQV